MLRWKIFPKPASELIPPWIRAPPEINSYARCSHFQRHVLNLADFLGHCFAQRAAVYGKVLCKNINKATVNRTAAGYDSVAKVLFLLHAEVGATVELEHVHFLKAAFVKKQRNTFARRKFAFCVLFFDGFLTSAQTGLGAFFY